MNPSDLLSIKLPGEGLIEGLAAEVAFCDRGGVHGLMWPQLASGWSTMNEEERISGAEAMLAAGSLAWLLHRERDYMKTAFAAALDSPSYVRAGLAAPSCGQ